MMKSLWDILSEKMELEEKVAEQQKTLDILLERNAELQRQLMHYDTLALLN